MFIMTTVCARYAVRTADCNEYWHPGVDDDNDDDAGCTLALLQLYHIKHHYILYVYVVILGHRHGPMFCLVAVPGSAWSACRDALKVASFCAVFRTWLEPAGRPLWSVEKMGEGKRRGLRGE